MNSSRPLLTGVRVAVLLAGARAPGEVTGAKYLFGLDCVELIKP